LEPAERTANVQRRWLRWVTWLGLAAALLALISPMRVADCDMWHQMALFREAVAQGSMPREDVFAYTPTVSPVIHHEWGHGAVLYLLTVTAGGGAEGLMVLKYLLTAAIAIGCVRCAMRRGAHWEVAAWLGLLAIVMGRVGLTTLRAQVFTLLLLVVLLLLLEEDRQGRRWWIALWLPVYVLWLNLHAGFVVGFGIFGLYTVERIVRESAGGASLRELPRRVGHLVLTGLVMTGLVLVNPYGLDYVTYLVRAISLPRPLVPEWRPLWEQTGQPEVLAVYTVSVGVVLYAVLCRGVRGTPGLLAVLATAYLAARHFRHLSLYAVVWMCYVPGYLHGTGIEQAIDKIGNRHKGFLLGFWSLVAVLAMVLATSNHFWQLQIPTVAGEVEAGVPIYPAGAVAYLAEQDFSGNVMVPFDAGGYVSWRLYPQVKVSLDSRYEAAYPPGAVEEHVQFYAGEGDWQTVLDRYETDAVLVPYWSPLGEMPEGGDGSSWPADWQRVYQDDGYSLFARTEVAATLTPVDRRGERIAARFP
jgi:hypothetical protein